MPNPWCEILTVLQAVGVLLVTSIDQMPLSLSSLELLLLVNKRLIYELQRKNKFSSFVIEEIGDQRVNLKEIVTLYKNTGKKIAVSQMLLKLN